MGKRVLAGLLAAAAIWGLVQPGSAQEAAEKPTPAFKAGKFFTQDDYEHLEAALACINLKPSDLKYEKKHRPDDKLRLKVCDAALDDPLGLPLVTQQLANELATMSPAALRSMQAARLLDRKVERWEADELQKDTSPIAEFYDSIEAAGLDRSKQWTEAEKKASAAAVAAIYKEMEDYQRQQFYGAAEIQELHLVKNGQATFGWQHANHLVGPVGALRRSGLLSPFDAQSIAARAPKEIYEAPTGVPSGKETLDSELFDMCANVDLEAILVAGSRLSTWLSNYMAAQPIVGDKSKYEGTASTVAGVSGKIMGAWRGPWGKVVIGGTGPNTYEGDDFIGIIDLGGDDVYKGRVACGIGLEGKAPISFVLDLSGNDRYEGGDFTQGFGFLGVGILHDLGGGDDYYKSRFCAQGCGLCGYGELYDDGGDDIYLADSGAQGAGCFGYGHLIDAKGNDTYRGARYVQGFAQVMGVGALTDGDGNDLYYAGGKYLHQPLWNDRYQSLSQGFSIGNRNDKGVGTGGGVALLLDEGNGNDVYQCDIYGQGSSYWYSLGMLVDRGGNDTYTLGQYGQGAGIHLSAAILYDESGNDTYSMGVGLGQGAAHDWAVGWQIDRAGNDSYQGSGQGMGLNFSVGILLDCAGDDSHAVIGDGSIGKGHNNDISLLMDLAGADSYGPKEVKDGQFTRRGPHQLVYDVPQGWFIGIDTSTWPTKQRPAPAKAVVQHILIAWDGTGIDTQKAARTKEHALTLARDVMKQARTKGADWKQLQADHNEDCAANEDGSVNTHNKYTAEPEARLVKPFKDLALSLGVGQIDLCESKYGWHIIKRVE